MHSTVPCDHQNSASNQHLSPNNAATDKNGSPSPAPRKKDGTPCIIRRRSSRYTTTGNNAPGVRRKSSKAADIAADAAATERDMWSNSSTASVGLLPGRHTMGPLFLMTTTPFFVIVVSYVLTSREGSLSLLWDDIRTDGILGTIYLMWQPVLDIGTWKLILVFVALEAFLMRAVPGRKHFGPISSTGYRPIYKANGFQVYCISLLLFCGGAYFGYYKGGILYDHIGRIISSMNIFALFFCGILYFKGIHYPSSSDHGSSGNSVFDYYWGTELYPSIAGWNIKQFTNCRLGMMFWPIYIISCALKQREMYGFVSSSMLVNVVLQLVYVSKFFWWETGYFSTIDIMHDRAGYYIVWGVLVWLPTIYTSHSTFLVQHPNQLGWLMTLALLAAGLGCIYVNYQADQQRAEFRAKKGRVKIWGKDPFYIEAKYKTEDGEIKTSLLLGSGYWGQARHFNYLLEIGASICWTLPVATQYWLPYFYVPYLVLLLVDRAVRDDARCLSKYGKYWEKHCHHVPCLFIPYVY